MKSYLSISKYHFFSVFFFLYFPLENWSQSVSTLDSSAIPLKTNSILKRNQQEHSASKAALFSAVLPGSGQLYNKKFWKAPLVWGGRLI